MTGKAPKFDLAERQYFIEAVRYVRNVYVGGETGDRLPECAGLEPAVWVVDEGMHGAEKEAYCKAAGIDYHVLTAHDLAGVPSRRRNRRRVGRK